MDSGDVTQSTAVDASSAIAREAMHWAQAHMAEFIHRLGALVEIDSGADCPRGRDKVARLLCDWGEEAGCTAELMQLQSGGHVVISLAGEGGARVVLLGHHDTVYTAGTAARTPYAIRGGKAMGPGVADMKGGLLVGLMTMAALAHSDRPVGRVELHSVPDEEVRTRPFDTLDLMAGAEAALVLECGRENGDLVSTRKTGAWLRLVVEGVAAHAGTEPELGRSAVLGLCHEILRCSTVSGARAGLTVIAGTIRGGSIANVVPAEAEAVLDVRASRRDDFDWALAELRSHGTYDGLRVHLEDTGTWPGIEPGPRERRLLEEAKRIAARLGHAIDGQTSGGMSDGCWTAAAGIPTLDGLGPVGGHDHSPEEYIVLDSVPLRCGLVAGLCAATGNGLLAGATVGKEVGEQRELDGDRTGGLESVGRP